MVPFPSTLTNIHLGDYYGDYRLIQGRLGWRPKVSLREGLARTLEFYHEHKQYYW